MPRGKKKGCPPTSTSGHGRYKGIPNKITTSVKEMILRALDKAGGEEYLVEQARLNPGPFLGLIGRIIPTALAAEVTHRDERQFSDLELAHRITAILASGGQGEADGAGAAGAALDTASRAADRGVTH